MTPYERTQLSRQRTAATFPLPSVLDCIRYAITELAEYDDALLRAERTGDKRNNDKAHDARSELGQALYMLLSAAVQLECAPRAWVVTAYRKMGLYTAAMERLANLLDEADAVERKLVTPDNLGDLVSSAFCTLLVLADANGWPVDALVDDTCNRFEAKHAAAQEAR
jgi:hypothetical protein